MLELSVENLATSEQVASYLKGNLRDQYFYIIIL